MNTDPPSSLSPVRSRHLAATERILGVAGVSRLRAAHAVVVGIGGVGSWATEALARAGVGRLTLIDLDHIAESNLNRQLHALRSTLGQSKVLAMQARLHDIDPDITVLAIEDFLTADNLTTYLQDKDAVVLDCIDQGRVKFALALYARQQGMRLILCGAAGGKHDPGRLRIAPLKTTTHDPLIAQIRSRLRRHADADISAQALQLPCVYSDEPVQRPAKLIPPAVILHDAAPLTGLACAGYGSLMTVTATMGLLAAAWAIQQFLQASHKPDGTSDGTSNGTSPARASSALHF